MKTLLVLSLLMIAPAMTSLADFTLNNIDGKPVALSTYSDKVVLVVNVASFCGYTKQYAPLEALYEKYKGKGLVVLGVPSNDFGAQEPGSDAEIKEFCTTKFSVTFPMFSKIDVKGADKHPFYGWLTSGGGNDALKGEVGWNFEKFLIDRKGRIVRRFSSKVDPMSSEMTSAIEQYL